MCINWNFKKNIFISLSNRPVARGVGHIPPNLAKGPLLATKWAKNGVFVGGLRGVRFKKSIWGVQKVHFWGVPHRLRFDPGYGPTLNYDAIVNQLLILQNQSSIMQQILIPYKIIFSHILLYLSMSIHKIYGK